MKLNQILTVKTKNMEGKVERKETKDGNRKWELICLTFYINTCSANIFLLYNFIPRERMLRQEIVPNFMYFDISSLKKHNKKRKERRVKTPIQWSCLPSNNPCQRHETIETIIFIVILSIRYCQQTQMHSLSINKHVVMCYCRSYRGNKSDMVFKIDNNPKPENFILFLF